VNDEFRVEVVLDDDARASLLQDRLRALDLDEQSRERLGGRVFATRDGSSVFLYVASDEQAREAGNVVVAVAERHGLAARIAVTRWHPVEEAWKDASLPLPRTPDEEAAEYAAREAAEAAEAEREGEYDWHVVVRVTTREEAVDVEHRLEAEGYSTARRWRYVVVGLLTEERAQDLATRLREELPDDAEISVEANVSDVELPLFHFIGF
jgi:hypothetical protein